jgi:hypothetical protein
MRLHSHTTPARWGPNHEALYRAIMARSMSVDSASSFAPIAPEQAQLFESVCAHSGSRGHADLIAVRMQGPLDVGVLELALARVAATHGSLMTRFVTAPVPGMVPAPTSTPIRAAIVDLRTRPVEEAEEQAAGLARELLEQGVDPFVASMTTPRIVLLSGELAVVMVPVHHLVSDAASHEIYLNDLVEQYRVGSSRRAESPRRVDQYSEYARESAGAKKMAARKRSLAFWEKDLADAFPPIRWPQDLGPTYRSNRVDRVLSTELLRQVDAVTTPRGLTTGMVLTAGWAFALHQVTGTDGVRIGIPAANRNDVRFQNTIGLFANIATTQFRLTSSNGISDWLMRGRAEMLKVLEHGHVPLATVLQGMRTARPQQEVDPLFETIVHYGVEARRSVVGGVEFTLLDDGDLKWDEPAFHPATLTGKRQADRGGLVLHLDYNTDLIGNHDADLLLLEVQEFFEAVSVEAAQMPYGTPAGADR